MGDGPLHKEVQSKITEYKLEENVILTGFQINPYRFIKNCDIYVQPSRFEGKCVTVREAQILNRPVVITDYASSKSQLEDGIDGLVVPLNNEGCARSIIEFIKNSELQDRLILGTQKKDYSNKTEINKILYEVEKRY